MIERIKTLLRTPIVGLVFRAYAAGAFGMLAMVSCFVGPAAAGLFFGIVSVAAVVSVFMEFYGYFS